jgi:hypothetical protein
MPSACRLENPPLTESQNYGLPQQGRLYAEHNRFPESFDEINAQQRLDPWRIHCYYLAVAGHNKNNPRQETETG